MAVASSVLPLASLHNYIFFFFKFVSQLGNETTMRWLNHKSLSPAGMYVCSKCNHPLFSSRSKFAHSSPWPAFTDTITEDSVTRMMESLTAYKVRVFWALFDLLLLLHHAHGSNISPYCFLCSIITWPRRLMRLCFTYTGSVWEVWQWARPWVCKWRPRGRSLTLLNIQSLAQVCPQQR